MVYDATPLTEQVLAAVKETWGIKAATGERLHGGEDSAAYRIGNHVIRIGPAWRTDPELEWSHDVAFAAGRAVPEAVVPLRTETDSTIVRVDGRPVSLWSFRDGAWPGDDDD